MEHGYVIMFLMHIELRLKEDCDTVYVYLSNKSEMSFEEAWKASGLSSNTDDYYSIEEAVLVELSSE